MLVAGHGAAKGWGCPQEAIWGCWGPAGVWVLAGLRCWGCTWSTRVQRLAGQAQGTSCKGREEGEALLETQRMRETHLRAGAAGICLLALFCKGLARGEGRELCSDADRRG